MNRIVALTIIFLISFIEINSQDICIIQSHHIRIDEEENVPIKTTKETDETIVLTHKEQFITDIFSRYIIYDFEKAFPSAMSQSLQNTYIIKFGSKDLINDLYEKVPNDIFYIESNYEGIVVNRQVVDFFSNEVVYNLKQYISTSDADTCTFDCELNTIPNDFKLTIKVHYDTTNELLVIQNTKKTTCGNSFIFKFKRKIDGAENNFVIWETITENPCLETSLTASCEIERIFFETILSNFNLSFNLSEGSFKIKAPNSIFGENVVLFEEESLSINHNTFSQEILISPNPIKDFLKLTTQEGVEISKVSVFDFSGKELISVNNSFKQIDASVLSSGIYFIRIKINNGFTISKKIVKE